MKGLGPIPGRAKKAIGKVQISPFIEVSCHRQPTTADKNCKDNFFYKKLGTSATKEVRIKQVLQ